MKKEGAKASSSRQLPSKRVSLNQRLAVLPQLAFDPQLVNNNTHN